MQVSACFASADFHYSNSLASVQAHAQAVCNAQRIACTVILHDGTVPRITNIVLFKTYVLFIPYFIFGFWSLLATNLQKYENIT